MTIFVTIVGTLLFVIASLSLLLTFYNAHSITQLRGEAQKQSVLVMRVAQEQMNTNNVITGMARAFNELAGATSMFFDELGYGGPITIIQTPLGNVPARNLNEAVDKLQAKGISLTDKDIEDLKRLFSPDEDEGQKKQ